LQLNRVIQETLSLLEHQFKKAGIQVRAKLDPRIGPVKGNPGKLQQVFLNLFLNARDAMAPGGILEVVTRPSERGVSGSESSVCVDVTDTVHGVAPKPLSRIDDLSSTTQ